MYDAKLRSGEVDLMDLSFFFPFGHHTTEAKKIKMSNRFEGLLLHLEEKGRRSKVPERKHYAMKPN